MSQHIYGIANRGTDVEVVLGFDSPLEAFFMTIVHGDEVLYSNLDDEHAFEKDRVHYRETLTELVLEVPKSMFLEAELDALGGGSGRRVCIWGTATSDPSNVRERV